MSPVVVEVADVVGAIRSLRPRRPVGAVVAARDVRAALRAVVRVGPLAEGAAAIRSLSRRLRARLVVVAAATRSRAPAR